MGLATMTFHSSPDIHVFKTRPDENGKRHHKARIQFSLPAGKYEVPPQKTIYTKKWIDRFSLWEEIDGILLLARALQGAGDQDGARRRFLEAVARRPDVVTQTALAEFLVAQGEIGEGRKIFDDLLARTPGSTKVKIAT